MGAYLSSPKTEKCVEDEENVRMKVGSAAMQGWRISQEDAHNAILDYLDGKCSFFAVYDGHGGSEVAQYAALKLPAFIKKSKQFKEGNFSKALEECFIDFDATLIDRDVVAELKKLTGNTDSEDHDPDEIDNLCQEATMPIEDVMAKYANNENGDEKPENKALNHLKAGASSRKNASPFLRAKKAEMAKIDENASENSNNKHIHFDENGEEVKKENEPEVKKEEKPEVNDNGDSADKSPSKEKENLDVNNGINGSEKPIDVKGKGKGKGKGKSSKLPPKPVDPEAAEEAEAAAKEAEADAAAKPKVKKSAEEIYQNMLNDDEEDESDDDDATFGGGPKDSSDDDDDDDEEVDLAEEDTEEEEDTEDEEEEEEEDGEEENEFVGGDSFNEEPGNDSGCTAVVGLVINNELFVANAGDSRCVVCRNGEAVEMSFDHKPEDKPEMDRIEKAGGQVTPDGRVNGGLNLSRALGDHAYKTNKELPLIEQMISPQPDIRTLRIDPKTDAFMILACDGIWNSMTSQEVIDFIKPKLEKNPDKVSSICEELFDACLSPDTSGDGTGCDNMTAVIVKFKDTFSVEEETNKRSATNEEDQQVSKKSKMETST